MAFCGYHPSGPECLISRPIAEDGGALPGAAPRSVSVHARHDDQTAERNLAGYHHDHGGLWAEATP